jgi:hypothetical protein
MRRAPAPEWEKVCLAGPWGTNRPACPLQRPCGGAVYPRLSVSGELAAPRPDFDLEAFVPAIAVKQLRAVAANRVMRADLAAAHETGHRRTFRVLNATVLAKYDLLVGLDSDATNDAAREFCWHDLAFRFGGAKARFTGVSTPRAPPDRLRCRHAQRTLNYCRRLVAGASPSG